MTKEIKTKTVKKKGIIRWEAIIPFTIICIFIGAYFHFFFDKHLKSGMEWVGYKTLGAEVNITNLETSFSKASLLIQKIELTDSENPINNILEIGEIKFSMLWDALLRVKFVINEAAVEQIAYNTKRAHPGKVAPPPPPSANNSEKIEELKAQALADAEAFAGENILGDIIAMLGGAEGNEQLDKLKESLPSKKMLEDFDKELKQKQSLWDSKLKSLPQSKDVEALNTRLKGIQTKDFKSPQELQKSLQELDKVIKDGDSMYKQVQVTADELKSELGKLEAQYKTIEAQIKTDIKSLEQHFRIPKIDAKSMTLAIFGRYLQPYRAKFYKYKNMALKYIPPNLLEKDESKKDEIIQPHPREEGISYEFGRKNAYPFVWIKRTAVSSQAGMTPEAGDIRGEIRDISSHQALTGKPTVATLAGSFPNKNIFGFGAKLSLDNTKKDSVIQYSLKVDKYNINGSTLVSSPDVKIAFNKAVGTLHLDGQLIGMKQNELDMQNEFNDIEYAVSSKNDIAQGILQAVFAGIPKVTLSLKSAGTLPSFPMSINSNLGPELQKGFEKQIQAKINEAKKKIEETINAEIGKQKATIDKEINKLRAQFEGEVTKVKNQIEGEKKKATDQISQTKKDTENQAKKQIEKEGKKVVDDLKKKFGL